MANAVENGRDERGSEQNHASTPYSVVDVDVKVTPRTPLLQRVKKTVSEPGALLCISHLFSYWGDRMWGFAVGLYLVEMTPNSLRLTAIYGLVRTLSVVIFGPAVGDWVDVTPRLRAVKLSLVTQNILVSLCAVMVLLHLLIHAPHKERAVYVTLETAIVVLGAMAFLVGRGTTIAVERDWVVVITDGDQERLAVLNTTLRRIDLTCAILGPAAVGFVMSLVSKFAGIILICSWNIASFFLEYYLLLHVYKRVPALASKGQKIETFSSENATDIPQDDDHEEEANSRAETEVQKGYAPLNILHRIRSFLKGWSVYARQTVALAGLSLAMLYLTFLGFSSITTGYIYTQHISEGVISACYAAASLVGILGTILFPPIRRKVGLPRTGLISFLLQLAMLALCVISIWLPGSPMLAKHTNRTPTPLKPSLNRNSSVIFWPSSSKYFYSKSRHNTARLLSVPRTPVLNASVVSAIPPTNTVLYKQASPSLPTGMERATIAPTNATLWASNLSSIQPSAGKRNDTSDKTKTEPSFSYWSVSILLLGLILSRAGLWMTDLTVTQLLQENVAETERGIVSGTQQAFNSILDLMHYVLTIFLPKPGQFWMLILVSYCAIVVGYIIYILFYVRFTQRLPKDESRVAISGSSEQLISDEEM